MIASEKPILMSGPMVRATLEGRKTKTRRALKRQPPDWVESYTTDSNGGSHFFWAAAGDTYPPRRWPNYNEPLKCHYGRKGGRLWVRETWGLATEIYSKRWRRGTVLFRADHGFTIGGTEVDLMKWKPSIHLPRRLCRLELRIKNIHAERLQEITEEDIIAEGVNCIHHGDGAYYYSWERKCPHPKNWICPEACFRDLWDTVNGAGAYDKNPWVWVIEYEKIDE